MADHLGLSQSMVSRVWRAFGLAPHKQDSWKLSKDPLFVEKVRDVVGLYLDPPERAVVLCVDEKTQIQALNRTQPVFPMLPGTPARASHDYVRHGTSSLYAALDLASLHALGSWGIEPAIWFLFVLNIAIPLGVLGWWVFTHVRPNTLY